MQHAMTLNKTVIKNKSITTAATVIAAIILPQIFHAVGLVSGAGPVLGATFLPMHFPVMLAGLLAGPFFGTIAGVLSPIISFAITGMPTMGILPLMVLELACYGLAAGLLSKVKLPVIIKVMLIQIAGRLVRIAAIMASAYLMRNHMMNVSATWSYLLSGLPGILLQWCLIPLLLFRIESVKKHND